MRVTGLQNEQDLTDVLKRFGAVQGHARVTQENVAGQETQGAVDFVKANSLRASGLFYLLGDALFIKSGLVRDKNKKLGQMGMGISFAVGDAALMAFGGKDDTRQFHSLLKKLKGDLDSRGIDVPDGTALSYEAAARPDGMLERTYDFLHENINSIKILAEVVGGGFCLKGGLEQKNNHKIASGVVIMTGWAASLLIHEHKRDPEQWKQADGLEKAKLYVQEKPLRLAGWAGLIHNAIYTAGAFAERKKTLGVSDYYKWDMAGVATMLVANSLYSICSKSTGGNIRADALVNDVYGIAAQIVNRQPDNVRDDAINNVVDYLGQRPEIKDTKAEIRARLTEEIEMQSQNPWFKSLRQTGKPLPGAHDKQWAKNKKTVVDQASHAASVEQNRNNQPTTPAIH